MDQDPLDIRENLAQLFPTPVVVYPWPDSDRLNIELRDIVLAKEKESKGSMRSNVGGWHSKTDFFHWNANCVREIENRVARLFLAVTRAMTAGQENRRNMEFNINGWANINRDRSYNNIHNHPNWIWSGCYYVSSGEPEPRDRFNGKLELIDPRFGLSLMSVQGADLAEQCLIDSEPGVMVMFPAWLNHQVHPFHGRGERISIGFNVFLREDLNA